MASRSTPARRRRPIMLAGLRGFEAAARRLSFTDAAQEMALTQSSISRQIAALERQVGKALFVRRTRALELTPAGARLQATVAQALGAIDGAVDEIRGVGQPPRVSLTTYASFASLWLVPRLAAFQRLHPRIEIRIDASDRLVDLESDAIDIAIRRCRPQLVAGRAEARLLCEELLTPALSPQLLERTGLALERAAELAQLPLIDMDDAWPAAGPGDRTRWAQWFALAGEPGLVPAAGRLSFSFLDQAVQAAIRGQGVVLGRTPLVEEAVAAGQLTLPFPQHRLPTGAKYYLLVNSERAQAGEVSAFSAWLVEEFLRGPERSS